VPPLGTGLLSVTVPEPTHTLVMPVIVEGTGEHVICAFAKLNMHKMTAIKKDRWQVRERSKYPAGVKVLFIFFI
jgi:hypothetical protein